MNRPPSTEGVHAKGPIWAGLDTRSALKIFAEADREAAASVESAHEELAQAVDLIAPCLEQGGRLFYVGAGTSGRLGALDAAECPPTFQSAPEQVQAILAGGLGALTVAVEGAEDDRLAGTQEALGFEWSENDCVLGISASGGAPFVHGFLEAAREAGAHALFLACIPREERPDDYELSIRLPTGPELLSGSTRMKAGTATKMALGALSTLVMARLGKVHQHRMVDVNTAGNKKLWIRGVRMVQEINGTTEGQAHELLQAADGSVKVACVMQACGLSATEAKTKLARHGGHLDKSLDVGNP